MFAKIILGFIQGKTVDYATKKVERWYREEYDATPEAFRFLEKDVSMVLDMVYQYHVKILIAQDLLSARPVDNADYMRVCVRVPKRGELEDLEELIREVEQMVEVSSGLRTQVRARVINYIKSSETQIALIKEQLRREEDQGLDFDVMKHTAIAVGRVARNRDRFRANKMMVERTGNKIDEQLAEALALLENVRTLLRTSQDGFAVIIKECNVWMNNWNRWDYNRGLGREAQ